MRAFVHVQGRVDELGGLSIPKNIITSSSFIRLRFTAHLILFSNTITNSSGVIIDPYMDYHHKEKAAAAAPFYSLEGPSVSLCWWALHK